jgi:predicted amidohydrolase
VATRCRIALANLPYPATPEDAVLRAERAVLDAGNAGARVVCFPECYVPGYRTSARRVPPPDPAYLEAALHRVGQAARQAGLTVVLGSERVVDGRLLITAPVIGTDGRVDGFQDKVQMDPSEDGTYAAGDGRQIFSAGPITFGIAICHEGWRYPETVRWAVRRGAHIVFHQAFHEAEAGGYQPTTFADPANTFHEKAALCRAAENTCFFATVNYASAGSPTTSAVVRPDGTLLAWQPYGEPGLLVAELDLAEATGLLAKRRKAYD